LGEKRKKPRFYADEIWKFEILLRKAEFYKNCSKTILGRTLFLIYYYRYYKLGIKLNFSIPLNVFGPGLSIAHYGTIVINGNAKIGENCRIQTDVTIGATNGNVLAPQIGNNVYIGSGAKLIGNIIIGNNTVIGANAVVNKSFEDGNITIAGVPAKKISDKNSSIHIKI